MGCCVGVVRRQYAGVFVSYVGASGYCAHLQLDTKPCTKIFLEGSKK